MASAVQAPFNTSPAYSGTFIPSIWSGKLNAKFYATTVFGEISNTNYEGEIKNVGDKVTINNIPSISINDYTVGQNLVYEVPAPSTVDLTIDKAKYFGVNVSDVLEYQAKPNLMSMFTDDASQQMAITIDRAILLAEFNNGAAANKGVDLFTAMSSTLDEQNVPETGRFLVIDPATRRLLMSSPLAQAYVTGDSQSMLRNGKIGMIDRFTIYVSNLLPKAAANQDFTGAAQGGSVLKRRAIIAGHTTAMTFAAQIAKTENLTNPNDFGTLVRGLNVYGHKMIKPEAWVLALVA